MRLLLCTLVCLLCPLRPLRLCGETPPALDATDQHYIDLALRAIKMSPTDLCFKKAHIESTLVLEKSRAFLKQPVALSHYATLSKSNLQTIATINMLADFSRRQVEKDVRTNFEFMLSGAKTVQVFVAAAPIEAEALNQLPVPVTRAVECIINAATAAKQVLQPTLTRLKQSPLPAIAVDLFHLDKDAI